MRCLHAGAPLLLELLLARPGRCMLHAEGSALPGTPSNAALLTCGRQAVPAEWAESTCRRRVKGLFNCRT